MPMLDQADAWPALAAFRAKATFPQQYAAVVDRAHFVHICAAIRTGKTYGAARAFMLRVIRDRRRFNPPNAAPRHDLLYWVLGPTYKQTRAQKKQLIDLIPSWQVDWDRQGRSEAFWDEKGGDGMVFLKGGVAIECRSAEDPESLVAEKVRGFWVTEAARVKQKALQNLDGRVANYADGWGIYDTSPFGHCAYYVDYAKPAMDGEAPGSSYHEWDAWASPYVPDEKIREAQARMAPSFFRRDFLASWDTFQGQIYHEWDERQHLRHECPFRPDRALVCVDINTADTAPAAFLVMLSQGQGEFARAHVESEFYRYGLGLDYDGYAASIAAQARSLAARGLAVTTIIDPSAHSRFKYLLSCKGVEVHGGKNEVLAGIRTMGGALHAAPGLGPRLTVAVHCMHFADEIKGYAWTVSDDGIVKESPNKGTADHLMDCCRYGCMEVFGGGGSARQVR